MTLIKTFPFFQNLDIFNFPSTSLPFLLEFWGTSKISNTPAFGIRRIQFYKNVLGIGFNKIFLILKIMSVPTFTECKNILEDFYKQRKHFIISEIEIKQVDPDISVYSYISDIHFTTNIKFKEDKFLIGDLYKNLKPIITFALSYTRLRKFISYHPNLILTEDDPIINYDYEYIDREIYVKDLKVILKTHYDFYDVDYDLYF